MGWLPQAIRRDVGAPSKFSNGPMRSYTGVVLHVNDADSGDLFGWITGDHGMSCHWQVTKDGTIYQYIATEYSSWCQGAGNDDYLSIETQGFPNEKLTPAQVQSCAAIMAYAHAQHGIPLLATDVVGQKGFIAHGDGGAAWGGHTACPGDLRKAQRPAILALASGESPSAGDAHPLPQPEPAKPAPEVDEMFYMARADNSGKVYTVSAAGCRWVKTTRTAMALATDPLNKYPDAVWQKSVQVFTSERVALLLGHFGEV